MSIAAFVKNAAPPDPPKERTAGRPRVRRGGRKQLTPLEVAIDDATHRAKSGDWDDAKGATLVGLYALCHRLIYGIVPDELQELPTFHAAAKLAKAITHAHFADDFASSAVFVKWCWEREKRKDTWARRNGIDRNRMSWRLQFSASMVTDWRIDQRKGPVR